MVRTRAAQASMNVQTTSLDKLYNVYAVRFNNTVRQKFAEVFPRGVAPSAMDAETVSGIQESLMESKEYWQALDDAYKEFSAALKRHRAANAFELGGMKLPANEAIAKAEILIRANYIVATEALNLLGMKGAWKKLGAQLRSEMKVKKGKRQIGVTRQSAYERLLEDPTVFGEKLEKANSLQEFLKEVTGNEAKAKKIYATLRKKHPTDFKLLQAAVRFKIAPDVDDLPKVTMRGKIMDKLYAVGRANLASAWGGAKGMAKLAKMIATRENAVLYSLGSRLARQAAYEQWARSKFGYKVTAPVVLGLFAAGYLINKCAGSPVNRMLESKPKKDPMGEARDILARSAVNRRAITKMLNKLRITVGGKERGLSEEEKLLALKRAVGSREDTKERTITDYVRNLAILQFSGRPANESIHLSKLIYSYVTANEDAEVNSKNQEAFARRALELSKKNPNKSVGEIFSLTMQSAGMAGTVTEGYWGRPFSPRVFEGFSESSRLNPYLSPLRARLRREVTDNGMAKAQMMGIAKTLASLYGKTVPKTYEADLEAAFALSKRGFGPAAIGSALSELSRYFQYYQKERANAVAAEVAKEIPNSAKPEQIRQVLIDYTEGHKGWVTRGMLKKYYSSVVGALIGENAAVSAALSESKRNTLIWYFSEGLLKGSRTYPQVAEIVGELGKKENLDKLTSSTKILPAVKSLLKTRESPGEAKTDLSVPSIEQLFSGTDISGLSESKRKTLAWYLNRSLTEGSLTYAQVVGVVGELAKKENMAAMKKSTTVLPTLKSVLRKRKSHKRAKK